MLAALVFSGAVAFFLIGCLIAALLTEPADDPFSDATDWDGPFISPDDLKLFHDGGVTK